jgi:hypothetical protein
MQGAGRITSTPTGIDCSPSGPTCGAYFQADSTVSLFALGRVDQNTHLEYDFDHWEGACTGVSGPVCSLPMNDPAGKTAKPCSSWLGTTSERSLIGSLAELVCEGELMPDPREE